MNPPRVDDDDDDDTVVEGLGEALIPFATKAAFVTYAKDGGINRKEIENSKELIKCLLEVTKTSTTNPSYCVTLLNPLTLLTP